MVELPRPELFEIIDPGHVTAMQWRPGDLASAGVLVGWLTGAGLDVHHPSGSGGSTTLAFRCDDCGVRFHADPGDWVVQGMTGHWFTWSGGEFDSTYRLMSYLDPPAAELSAPSGTGEGELDAR